MDACAAVVQGKGPSEASYQGGSLNRLIAWTGTKCPTQDFRRDSCHATRANKTLIGDTSTAPTIRPLQTLGRNPTWRSGNPYSRCKLNCVKFLCMCGHIRMDHVYKHGVPNLGQSHCNEASQLLDHAKMRAPCTPGPHLALS